MRVTTILNAFLIGATIVMTQTAAGAPDAASDLQIDPRVRTFLADHSSPFFWELLPGPQVRAVCTKEPARPGGQGEPWPDGSGSSVK